MDLAGLVEHLGGERVLTGAAVERTYDCDAYSVDRSKPNVVVLPESTDEVAAVVRWCNEQNVPFVARGAGTGLSGGALAAKGGLVISTKRMTRILEVDLPNKRLRAQAGAVNTKLTDAVKAHGLHFAPDPSSQSVSTLGGNIAENSGGPHTLKYGVTAPHILALTMVDPVGEILHLHAGMPGYDFVSLVVGAEGTLGIVTEAWVKLTPVAKFVKTALVSFQDVASATESVSAIIASGVIPAALEMMDRGILKALNAAFGLTFPAGTEALLLIECDGEEDEVSRDIDYCEDICTYRGAIDFRIAKDDKERQEFWKARKKGVGAMGRLAPTIVTHDGVIPRSKLPEVLQYIYEVAERKGLNVANLFHAGDGNLHPCFYFDDRISGQVEAVVEAGEEILRRCVELGGSITGEHGVGVEKLDFMPLMFSNENLEIQSKIKAVFNSGELCNPCKVLPNQKGCVEHQRRWRGAAW